MPTPQLTPSALAALDTLPSEAIPAAIITLAARLAASQQQPDDKVLTAAALAKELAVDVRYVWKNWRSLGGKRLPNSRSLRFSLRAARRRVA
jgi:hypothetical protein